MEGQSMADPWEAQGPLTQLDWEQLLQSPPNGSSMRKRNRPTSFDVISLQFPDGGSQFTWPQQDVNGDAGANEALGQLFGGYGERVDSFLAESADSAAENPKALTSTSETSQPFANFEPLGDAALFGRHASDPLPPPSQASPTVSRPGNAAPFARQVSDPLPSSSPAVAKLAPSRSQKVVSKSMTTEEIYQAYAQSWGGALKAAPKGGVPVQRQPSHEKPPGTLQRNGSKSEKAANAAKAQAASIIRDLFRRPGAKRQAVPLEGGQIGTLERGFSQLSAQPPNAPAVGARPVASGGSSGRNPVFGPMPVASGGSSGENPVSAAESQSMALPPLPSPRAQAVPKGSGAALNGGAAIRSNLPPAPGAANDLASLQQEAQALLATMGGARVQEKDPPAISRVRKPPTNPAGQSGSNFDQRGRAGEPQECPLLRSVQVAGCQVALACPVEYDEELLVFDVWHKISDGCPMTLDDKPIRDKRAPTSVSALDELSSLDWLLQSGDEGLGLGVNGQSAGVPQEFGTDAGLWDSDFSELLEDVDRAARGPLDTAPDAQSGGSAGPTKAADPVPTPIRHPLHHLWAQLEPAQVSEKRFQGLRTAYREEVRRLRVWAATFVGDVLLPSVAETHFVSCNALPNMGDRHVRMMLSKGMLWSGFVTHSLVTASPADIYFARHDGAQAYRGTNPAGLDNMTPGMQVKCKNMCFVTEDLKDEATYGPEIFRTYGAQRKSVGLSRPHPPIGYACHQVTFPELTDPGPGRVSLTEPPPELIQFGEPQPLTKCTKPQGGVPMRWSNFWLNKQRLLSTGRGMREAGERARGVLQTLFERTIDAHVEKFDIMASGVAPTLDRYLSYARFESGLMVGMGLAFCTFGQSFADAGCWEPSADDVEQLFEEAARAMELAGNVVRIMSDLRTYQADLVQLRPNAVAIRMREAHCSHKEALDFLIARVAGEIEALGAEIKLHAARTSFEHACWRLPFELCRVGVAFFTVLGADGRVKELFELENQVGSA